MELSADFIVQTKKLLGDDWDAFYAALQEEPPVSIRINKAKYIFELSQQKVKWNNDGYYLEKRPSFTFDPLFHAGCYYPQEASSMFAGYAIGQFIEDDSRILDLCAAPGGKSTHILSLLKENCLLVSNEVIRSRANILSENIIKSGNPNTIVSNNDPADLGKLAHYFDIVLIDAPCSGEGMFRKDEGAITEWSLANVNLCYERQRRIVSDVWESLKPGGVLVYSTCTYNLLENERNVQWICSELGAETVNLNIPDNWQITGALEGNVNIYRFLPHKTKGEGFFLAVLRKDEEALHVRKQKKNKANKNVKQKLSDSYKSYIQHSDKYNFVMEGSKWIAYPKSIDEDLALLKSQLWLISYGITIGEEKGKDFIPDHSLAMSNLLNRDMFTTLEIDWQTAIAYLRKEALALDNDLPKGYILLLYKNTPLGFVKNLGTRANNLYPQEWRIRSSNIPEYEVNILT